jgi:rod shape-determining protein MreD
MVDPVTTLRFGYRGLFLALSALVLFVRMLPLSAMPSHIPGPDLLFCLTAAFVLRRGDYAPALMVALVILLEDILTMRPPGLWAVVVLAGSEFLRSRATLTRDLPFPLEWAMVAAVMVAMTLANRFVLAVFMVPQAGFGPVMLQVAVTVLAYPIVIVVAHFAVGLRKAAPGEVDALGHRL